MEVEKDSVFCPDCWNKKLETLTKYKERFKRMSKHLAGKVKVVIEGIVEEDPQIFAYGSGHDWVTRTIFYVFPMKMTKLIASPEGITTLPVKKDDVFMVEFKELTYVKKGHAVEVEGNLKTRNYKLIDQSGYVFEAEKLFNLTYGYSHDY